LRVIVGYQHAAYDNLQKQRFFTSEYRVTKNCDRMGYRLEGAAITGAITGILSEGICQGAIQIPADGQPIILLSDRQTIGGYPKLGSVLSLDLDRLAQLGPGGKVRFEPISIEQAHNLLLLAEYRLQSLTLTRISHDPSATQHSD
jgi:allophanate hydrolase subunit 2